MQIKKHISNTIKLLRLDKRDISNIYIYAIAGGLISLGLPLGIQAIIGFVMASQLSTSLILLITAVVLATFIYGFFQINQLKLIEKIKQKTFVRFSLAFDEKLAKLDIQKNRSYNLSELMNRFFDTLTFQKSMSKLLIDIPTSTIQIFLGLILLGFYHPLFILFGIFLLLTLYLLLRYTGVQGMETSVKESNHKYELAYWLEEQADNIKDVQSKNVAELKHRKTNHILNQYIDARTAHFKILNLQYWSLTLFKVVLTAVMLIVGTYLLLSQLINIGQFVAAEIIIILLLSAIEKMIYGLDSAYDLITSTKKLYDVFDLPENDSRTPISEIPEDISQLQVDNLSLLSDDNKMILQNIYFVLKQGDICEIAGTTGSGKSTLMNVLAGVYNNYQGRLMADDFVLGNHAGLPPNRLIATHFKESDLMETTIFENVNLNKKYPLTKIITLAKRIGFHDYISALPNGYQTIIEAHKTNIPSGVRQMVLLLRTFISNAPIYVLESPFDNLNDSQIKSLTHFWQAATDKIIIYSLDNVSPLQVANKQVNLHNGEARFINLK